jgi:activator of 2-hydroxyglutaryl-CoA dehydratase
MTGGVAKNKGMLQALADYLGYAIQVGDVPQENGAVGAAVLAAGT